MDPRGLDQLVLTPGERLGIRFPGRRQQPGRRQRHLALFERLPCLGHLFQTLGPCGARPSPVPTPRGSSSRTRTPPIGARRADGCRGAPDRRGVEGAPPPRAPTRAAAPRSPLRRVRRAAASGPPRAAAPRPNEAGSRWHPLASLPQRTRTDVRKIASGYDTPAPKPPHFVTGVTKVGVQIVRPPLVRASMECDVEREAGARSGARSVCSPPAIATRRRRCSG